eukprot:8612308-Pyramimonas_sp.AAC.1
MPPESLDCNAFWATALLCNALLYYAKLQNTMMRTTVFSYAMLLLLHCCAAHCYLDDIAILPNGMRRDAILRYAMQC